MCRSADIQEDGADDPVAHSDSGRVRGQPHLQGYGEVSNELSRTRQALQAALEEKLYFEGRASRAEAELARLQQSLGALRAALVAQTSGGDWDADPSSDELPQINGALKRYVRTLRFAISATAPDDELAVEEPDRPEADVNRKLYHDNIRLANDLRSLQAGGTDGDPS